MDKRNFIAFLILSMGVLILSSLLFPPPRQQQQQQAAVPADDERQSDEPAADEAQNRPPAAQVPELEVPVEAANEPPLELLTLGSLDGDTGYRMLVTLTNRGAAVQRVEMTSPRFRDLNDRSGYLGHLELEDTPDGPRVRVVGPGTPAQQAGIQVGDVVTGIQPAHGEMVDVQTAEAFHAVRSKTRPRQEIMVRVVRDGVPLSFAVRLSRRPLEVMRPEVENIRMRDGTVPEGFIDPPSFLMTVASLGGQPVDESVAKRIDAWLNEGHWTVAERDERSITFERPLPAQNLVLVKRYTLDPVPAGSRNNKDYPGYHVTLDVEVRNVGDEPQLVAYRLDGPTGLPIEGWWYAHKISRHRWLGGAGLRDVVARYQGRAVQQFDCMTIAQDKAQPMGGHGQSLAYVGVDAVYFSAVLIPEKQSLDDDWFDITEAVRVGPKPPGDTPLTYTNVSCRLTRDPVELAAGASQKDSYRVFIGPKRPELLTQYQAANDPNYSLRDLVYFGWFGAVARAMLVILHWFYGFVGNYGIAIVMLTVLVRGAMFPISFKQTQNMARMQALKPELDRISEKYKGDMQKRSQAMQELYRKHKINPLGGCLPLFLQLPIFIGLYRAIMIDIELRQTPLFTEAIRWCSDLSAPDMLYDWSWFMPRMVNNGIGILGLGPYLNVLPIVTVALFLVSMRMSMPEPTNEQTAMQQKMMKYMTIFFGLLFYKVASGLCIYFIASSIWGIGERKLLTRARDESGSLAASPAGPPARDAAPARDSRNGSAGRKKGPKARRKR